MSSENIRTALVNKVRDYMLMVHLAACLRRLVGCLEDYEFIDEDDSWVDSGELSRESERSPEIAIRHIKRFQDEIWRSELLASMISSSDFKRPILTTLVHCHEAIGQADVPAETALLDGEREEATQICYEAMLRACESCEVELSRNAAACLVEAKIAFPNGCKSELVRNAFGFDILATNLNTIPTPELSLIAEDFHATSGLGNSLDRLSSETEEKRSLEQRAENIEAMRFRVALSFPGEIRGYVETVAVELQKSLGPNSVFYDSWYAAELARPNLDLVLYQLYSQNADLVVVFLCKEYKEKEWCGLEWRIIRELIKKREEGRIMLMRFDTTEIEGMFSLDGYVDLGDRSPEDAAQLVAKRAIGRDWSAQQVCSPRSHTALGEQQR